MYFVVSNMHVSVEINKRSKSLLSCQPQTLRLTDLQPLRKHTHGSNTPQSIWQVKPPSHFYLLSELFHLQDCVMVQKKKNNILRVSAGTRSVISLPLRGCCSHPLPLFLNLPVVCLSIHSLLILSEHHPALSYILMPAVLIQLARRNIQMWPLVLNKYIIQQTQVKCFSASGKTR